MRRAGRGIGRRWWRATSRACPASACHATREVLKSGGRGGMAGTAIPGLGVGRRAESCSQAVTVAEPFLRRKSVGLIKESRGWGSVWSVSSADEGSSRGTCRSRYWLARCAYVVRLYSIWGRWQASRNATVCQGWPSAVYGAPSLTVGVDMIWRGCEVEKPSSQSFIPGAAITCCPRIHRVWRPCIRSDAVRGVRRAQPAYPRPRMLTVPVRA